MHNGKIRRVRTGWATAGNDMPIELSPPPEADARVMQQVENIGSTNSVASSAGGRCVGSLLIILMCVDERDVLPCPLIPLLSGGG
jgi:hypothetical protein